MAEDKIFQITLKALSPISITKREFGILYETYHFIPAWTMWNCFVKLYAIKDKNFDYKSTKECFKNLRLSNFYILEKRDNIVYELSDEKKRKFISSDLKNAIDTLTNTSLEGALYEREYIVPNTEFVGWGKTNDESIISFINELKKNKVFFFVGADKNTGFGKICITNIETNETSFLDGGNAKEIIKSIKTPKNTNYLLPVEFEEKDIFPFVVREWDNEKGSGMKIEFVIPEALPCQR